jgi:hypothetical protein
MMLLKARTPILLRTLWNPFPRPSLGGRSNRLRFEGFLHFSYVTMDSEDLLVLSALSRPKPLETHCRSGRNITGGAQTNGAQDLAHKRRFTRRRIDLGN